jgi:hypothetical protein
MQSIGTDGMKLPMARLLQERLLQDGTIAAIGTYAELAR